MCASAYQFEASGRLSNTMPLSRTWTSTVRASPTSTTGSASSRWASSNSNSASLRDSQSFVVSGVLSPRKKSSSASLSSSFSASVTPSRSRSHKLHHSSSSASRPSSASAAAATTAAASGSAAEEIRDIWRAYEREKSRASLSDMLAETLRSKNAQVNAEFEQTLTRNDRLMDEIESLRTHSKSQQLRIDDLDDKLAQQSQLLNHYRDVNSGLESRNSELLTKLDDRKHQLRDQEKLIQALQDDKASLRDQLQNVNALLDYKRSQLQKQEEVNVHLQASIEQVQDEYKQAQRSYASSVSRYRADLQDASTRLASLQSTMHHYHSKLTDASASASSYDSRSRAQVLEQEEQAARERLRQRLAEEEMEEERERARTRRIEKEIQRIREKVRIERERAEAARYSRYDRDSADDEMNQAAGGASSTERFSFTAEVEIPATSASGSSTGSAAIGAAASAAAAAAAAKQHQHKRVWEGGY